MLPASARQTPLIQSYETENGVYKALVEANQLIASGSYSQARDLLIKSEASDPTSYSANLHLQLATCYQRLKEPELAVAEAQTSLKFDPQSHQAMYFLALSENDLGHYDRAIQLLNQLKNSGSDHTGEAKRTIKEITVYKNVKQAEKLMSSGHNADARAFLEKAAAFDPCKFSGCVHSNLSYVLERTGDPEAAIIEGKKALQYDPTDKTTMYSVAIAYQDTGNFNDAISWLRRYVSVETDPTLKEKASNFMQELADDRSKLDPKANSKPDYLDQLKANDAAHTWAQEKMPLKIYISPAKNVFGYRAIFKPFVIRSLNTWCEVSGKKISYKIVDDKNEADITMGWTREPLAIEENNRTRQKAGLTDVDFTPDKNLEHAVVRVRTVNGFEPSKLITDGECASTTMHEIGHALGLGHSTCCSDIMYFGSSSKQTGFPSKRDKATIARLYLEHPAVTFTPVKAPISTTTPIEYLPPPAFLPPARSNVDKLPPPMFMPPPAKSQSEKLEPPMFVPPPVKHADKNKNAAPTFLPPPVEKSNLPPKSGSNKGSSKRDDSSKVAPPMFVPPPK